MKKLIIHIGYPKTATTTLQDGLFISLHEKGLINYLGRSREADSDQFEQAGRLSRSLFKDKKIGENEISLSSDLLNILSEETLTFPTFYKEKQWGEKLINSIEFPKAMYQALSEKSDEIKILVTIRNQQELIYSLFITKYRMFLKDEANNGPDKFLFHGDGSFKHELFSIYYYSNVIEQYAEVFGKKNIHILFYEDFKTNPELFLQKLSELLNVDSTTVKPLLSGVHHRMKKKSGSGYVKEIKELNKAGKVIERIEKAVFNIKGLRSLKKKYDSNKLTTFVKKRFLTNKDVYIIPKLASDQKRTVFEEFKGSNEKLSEKFDIDKEKLKKYNYI